jgi:hypothetical protein
VTRSGLYRVARHRGERSPHGARVGEVPGERSTATRVNQRIAAAGLHRVEIGERGRDRGQCRVRCGHAASLPASGLRDQPALAAIRSSRFYAWDETVRSQPSIRQVTSGGKAAVAADRFAQTVHPPDMAERLAVGGGAILAQGKRTVRAALRILGRERETDFPIYHGVFNRAVWSSRAVAGWLPRLLVATFVGADATVVIGIDDTIERRWGRKISARGIYRDPVRSTKGHFVKTSGLRWLSAQLLVHVPWAGRIMGLPFLTLLAPSKTLLCRPAASAQNAAGPGTPSRFANPPLAAWPPDCHRRRHRIRRRRVPGHRPKLCQRRHPIAPRRQSLCPRTTETTGSWAAAR